MTISPTSRVVRPGRPGRPLRIEDIQAGPRPGAPVPHPGGTALVCAWATLDEARERMTSRLVAIDVATGERRFLTAPERHAVEPRFDAGGSRLTFLARAADKPEEPLQVHVLPWTGGEAQRVTDLPLGAFDAWIVPGRDVLLVGTWVHGAGGTLEGTREEVARRKETPVRVHRTERRFFRFWDRWLTDERRLRFVLVDLADGSVEDRLAGQDLFAPLMEPSDSFDVAADGSAVLFTGIDESGPDGRLRSDVFELSLLGAPTAPVRRTADEPGRCLRGRWLPDGSFVYGTTRDWDFYADRPRLHVRAPDGTITPWMADEDMSPSAWIVDDDGSLLFLAEDGGAQRLFRLAAGSSMPVALTGEGTWAAVKSLGAGRVAGLVHDLSTPPHVVLREADGSTRRLAPTVEEALPADVALAEVREVGFTGARGDHVQMYVLRPAGADGATPLVHLVHGGPHGQFGDAWHPRWNAQAFAADGATVAMVNFHGSTGFGQEFAQCIQGTWGEMPSDDVHKATDLLVAGGVVDGARVALAGGSYGGYLVSWLASTSDRFACVVNHAGVYDLALQYGSDITFGRARNMGGDLWSDPDAVDRWNPARHSAGLATPMLVVHGERDYRVPVGHAYLCYGLLKAKGVPARLVLYEDENHWVLKPANSRVWYEEVLGWINRFVGARAEGA
ncbi:MAG: prolyl oligopeptidase family serine peptidase [Planctomycetota bacterium]